MSKSISVLTILATTLNRRDEIPNIELAEKITLKKDTIAVKELINLLQHKSKDIRFDSIKVLYEIAERDPSLIKPFSNIIIDLLQSKDNRMVWGAMHALDALTIEDPKSIHDHLPFIMLAAEKGSVITKDHAVGILLKLCRLKKFSLNAFILFIELLENCPPNQVPMYAENAISIIDDQNKQQFIRTLRKRIPDIEKETKIKRVEKVIKKIS